MVSDTSSSSQSAWYPESKIVGVVMISFALFTPFLVYMSFDIWGTFEYTIDALLWRYYSMSIPHIMFGMFGGILLYITRFWFVIEMYRGYMNYGSRKRLLVVGFLSELPLVVPSLVNTIMNALNPSVGIPIIMIPLPILFIAGLIFIILAPPPKLTLFDKGENQTERVLT